MNTEHPVNRRWSMRQRDWAVVLWIAFLAASAGAFVLFGLVNPLDMVSRYLSIVQADIENAHKESSPVANWLL